MTKEKADELQAELADLHGYIRNWHALFPYEKQNTLARLRKLVYENPILFEDPLTWQTLGAINKLTISR